MSPFTFPPAITEQEAAELKAHHLACSHLVKGCQQAIFQFRKQAPSGGDEETLRLAQRTIEILEDTLQCWCETLSIVRSALERATTHDQGLELDLDEYAGVLAGNRGRMATFIGETPNRSPHR